MGFRIFGLTVLFIFYYFGVRERYVFFNNLGFSNYFLRVFLKRIYEIILILYVLRKEF